MAAEEQAESTDSAESREDPQAGGPTSDAKGNHGAGEAKGNECKHGLAPEP
jgi:hypothetical protein